jgi:hypothetical protein
MDKAIMDIEKTLKALTGKAEPFAVIEEGMTEEESEMEILAAYLKQGLKIGDAETKTKEAIEKLRLAGEL